jgi:ribosome modulation factor
LSYAKVASDDIYNASKVVLRGEGYNPSTGQTEDVTGATGEVEQYNQVDNVVVVILDGTMGTRVEVYEDQVANFDTYDDETFFAESSVKESDLATRDELVNRIYYEGYKSGARGIGLEANPYPDDGVEFLFWRKGNEDGFSSSQITSAVKNQCSSCGKTIPEYEELCPKCEARLHPKQASGYQDSADAAYQDGWEAGIRGEGTGSCPWSFRDEEFEFWRTGNEAGYDVYIQMKTDENMAWINEGREQTFSSKINPFIPDSGEEEVDVPEDEIERHLAGIEVPHIDEDIEDDNLMEATAYNDEQALASLGGGDESDIVKRFQASVGSDFLGESGGHSDDDLAKAAQAFLKTAGKNYSPMEQLALIDEEGSAEELGLLDLSNTHYVL